MLLRYLGEYTTESRSYGCSKCGTGTTVSGKEVYKTRYQFYDGRKMVVFNQGSVVEVDDTIGAFLLRKQHRDKTGKLVNNFEQVDDDLSNLPE